jgi:methylmalonyl-CoA mutase N-terminal domain/subunit
VEKDEKVNIPILYISPEVQKNQVKRLTALKQSRNAAAVKESLAEIKKAAVDGSNLMPVFVKAARNYVSLGEMVGELKEVFGTYEEAAVF